MLKLFVMLSAAVVLFCTTISVQASPLIDRSLNSSVLLHIKTRTRIPVKDKVIENTYWGTCSGVILEDGHILTAAHCVDAKFRTVVDIWIKTFKTGNCQVSIVKIDVDKDLALLKPSKVLKSKIKIANQIRVGDPVFSISSPFDFDFSLSQGIVSHCVRYRPNFPNSPRFIQTTVPMAPGSSGGPLFNMRGELVGINSVIISPGPFPSWSGISLHVSFDDIKAFLR